MRVDRHRRPSAPELRDVDMALAEGFGFGQESKVVPIASREVVVLRLWMTLLLVAVTGLSDRMDLAIHIRGYLIGVMRTAHNM